jgi:hypothetical protein
VRGLEIGRNMRLTHLLFIDDILIFSMCEALEGCKLKEILDWLCDVMIMLINDEKSSIFFLKFVEEERV